MITWEPCQTSACVQTGTDENGNVWVRSSVFGDPHDFRRCHCDRIGRCLAHCPTCGCGPKAVFTQAEWDEHLDSIRREERQRIRELDVQMPGITVKSALQLLEGSS